MLWQRALMAVLALPLVVAFLVPNLIAIFDPWRMPGLGLGLLLLLLGVVLLVWCVRDFYVAGKGTLAPWNPPEQLVIVGLYRYSRNPMYVVVLIILSGRILLLGSPVLVVYTVGVAYAFHHRVVRYEELRLRETFASAWEAYEQSVPRWLGRKPRS